MPSLRMKHQDALMELEVEEGATEVELRTAYKRQAMIWHPDRNSAPEAKETFQRKHAAYDRLVIHANMPSEDEDEDDDYSDEEYEAAFAEMFWEFMMHQTRKRSSSFPGFGFTAFGFGPAPGTSTSRPRTSSGYQPAGFGGGGSRSKTTYYGGGYEDEDDVPDFGPSEEAAWRDHQRGQDRQRRDAEAKQRRKEEEAYQRQINAEYEGRMKAQQEARAKAGQQLAEEAASAERAAIRQAAVRKLPRPTTLQRRETDMQLHLRRDKRDSAEGDLPEGCRYELQLRKTGQGSEAAWEEVAHDKPRAPIVNVSDLTPGTRYAFRSRSGCQVDESDEMLWGTWSAESQYVTLGNAPTAAQPRESKPVAVPEGRGKKARKREAKHKTGAKSGGSATFAEPELDLAAERERVKEQKAREAAVKAMQEKAAQEYRKEAARVAAEASSAKAAAQAQAAARAKARMKPRSSIPPSSTTFSAQNPSAASGEAAAGGKFSFGGVRGVAPQILTSTGGSHYDYREHLPAHQRKPGSGKDRNEPPPPVFQPSAEAYGDDEEEQLREAIELSLALEESRKLYADDYSYEEDENAFPALANGKPAPSQQPAAAQQLPASYQSSSSGDWNTAAQPFAPARSSFISSYSRSTPRPTHAQHAVQQHAPAEGQQGYYADDGPSDESSQSHAEYAASVPAHVAPAGTDTGDWDAAYNEHNQAQLPGPAAFYPPPSQQSYQPPSTAPPRRYNPGSNPSRAPPAPTVPPMNSFDAPRSSGYTSGEQAGPQRGPPGYRAGPSSGPPPPPGLPGRAPYRPPGQWPAYGRAGSGQGSTGGSTGSTSTTKSPFTHLFPQEAS